MEQADVIVIGSGQGGVPFATKLASEGRRVVLFERGHFGGSCLNYGCYPSKAFLYAAHLAGLEAKTGQLGLRTNIEVNFPDLMERVRKIVAESSKGVEESLKDSQVKAIAAEAAFVGERTVKGGNVTVEAPLIVINTGNSPFVPPINGLKGTPYFTYLNFWELDVLPPTTIIIGGGYIGLELGQGLAQLGSQVHVIEMQKRIAHTEEPDVSEILAESLQDDGVNIYTNTRVEQVDFGNEIFTVTLSNGERLKGQALMVATGQVPNTEALNAPEAGIGLDERGFVKVDDQFRTTADGIYAIGDVTGQPAFTHVSWEDHRRLLSILEGGDRTQGDRVLGYAFFTDPQVGRAGLTLKQAQDQGYEAKSADLPLSSIARAYLTGQNRGFYRMVIDQETDQILGATLVGPNTAELVHVMIAHMEAGSTWQILERSVHIHPTFAEGLPSLARKFK